MGEDRVDNSKGADEPPKPLWQRLGWLVLIWVASVASLAVFAMLIRLFMNAAGMKSH